MVQRPEFFEKKCGLLFQFGDRVQHLMFNGSLLPQPTGRGGFFYVFYEKLDVFYKLLCFPPGSSVKPLVIHPQAVAGFYYKWPVMVSAKPRYKLVAMLPGCAR